MKVHPLLDDPRAVLISRTPVADPVTPGSYRRAAHQVLAAMQVELEGENAVLKPNVTSGENFADPDSGITFVFSTHDTMVIDQADRVVRLHDGEIVADESRGEG